MRSRLPRLADESENSQEVGKPGSYPTGVSRRRQDPVQVQLDARADDRIRAIPKIFSSSRLPVPPLLISPLLISSLLFSPLIVSRPSSVAELAFLASGPPLRHGCKVRRGSRSWGPRGRPNAFWASQRRGIARSRLTRFPYTCNAPGQVRSPARERPAYPLACL
jgi:hypothetical protein